MRTLSPQAVLSTTAAETDEVWLALVTIDHPSLPAPIRLANNIEDVTSRGETFIACAFNLLLPGEDPESQVVARLQIGNVDRQIVIALRGLTSPPVFTIEVILASSPDYVELSLPDLVLRSASYDAEKVTGELVFESIYVEPIAVTMTPARFPGMF